MSDDWNRWPAQEPPADFADRTVAAMLRVNRPARRMGSRWFIPLAAAALLVGSASWAMIAMQPAPVVEPTPVVDPVPEVAPAPPPPPAPVAVPAPPEPEVEPPPAPAPRPRPLAVAPAPPVEAEPDAGAIVVVPRCICEHGTLICSCVE